MRVIACVHKSFTHGRMLAGDGMSNTVQLKQMPTRMQHGSTRDAGSAAKRPHQIGIGKGNAGIGQCVQMGCPNRLFSQGMNTGIPMVIRKNDQHIRLAVRLAQYLTGDD